MRAAIHQGLRPEPDWDGPPALFERVLDQGLTNLTPWHIFSAEEANRRVPGLRKRYRTKIVFPFAYRQDNDDIACWEQGRGETVTIVHDFASPGWERHEEFETFEAWFRVVIDELIEWD